MVGPTRRRGGSPQETQQQLPQSQSQSQPQEQFKHYQPGEGERGSLPRGHEPNIFERTLEKPRHLVRELRESLTERVEDVGSAAKTITTNVLPTAIGGGGYGPNIVEKAAERGRHVYDRGSMILDATAHEAKETVSAVRGKMRDVGRKGIGIFADMTYTAWDAGMVVAQLAWRWLDKFPTLKAFLLMNVGLATLPVTAFLVYGAMTLGGVLAFAGFVAFCIEIPFLIPAVLILIPTLITITVVSVGLAMGIFFSRRVLNMAVSVVSFMSSGTQ